MAKADTINHTHIWATTYDKTNHWEYCTVCGEKRNVTAHAFTDHWNAGTESCYYSNFSNRICDCGYSYIYHKPHSGKTGPYQTGRNFHIWKCASCGQWIDHKTCSNDNGKTILSCANPGTCTACGYRYTVNHHNLSNGTCVNCHKKIVEYSLPIITYSDDHSSARVEFTVTPLVEGVTQNPPSFYADFANATQTWGVSKRGNVYTCTGKFTFVKGRTEKSTYEMDCSSINVNGINVRTEGYSFELKSDVFAPVQNDVIQTNQTSANGWTTIKQLTLTGTENASDTVYLSVSDKLTGEKYITDAAVSITNGKYSYTCTPPIEGDIKGRTYVVTARDRAGNTSTKEFVISKTDGSAPQLKSGTSLTYTDWSTSKNISLSFFDFGAGGVQASLDNQTDYKALTKSGEYYVLSHTFGNQVGTTEHTIYVRDALGNARSYKLTVGNTDSNVYSITYSLNGGTMSGQKTSYTVTDSFTLPQPTKTGYTFTGWTESNGTTPQKTVTVNKGTRGNLNYTANWSANSYENGINHWAWGFKNGEGNNTSKNAFHLLPDTSFKITYGNTFVLNEKNGTRVPNGFCLRTSFGTGSVVNGAWKIYNFNTSIIQKAGQMYFEYDYEPISYSITYNLNGGTNNSANPSAYNVLYGVSLKPPARTGYTFTGWYDESDNKITGINEGCNATFSSADDLYAKLAERTTGSRTLTAKWSYNPVSVKVPQVLIANHTGTSQFRVKCDDLKTGNIKVTVPNSFPYKQAGKTDVTAVISAKSGNNTITPANKVCIYDITTKRGLSAGCWQGSFNIGLTLTKE